MPATRPCPARCATPGYDPALVGYTTTTPDPRTTGPRDPRFTVLGDNMDGFRSVGAFEPDHDGYFGWLAQKGYQLPANRDDIWLPDHESSRGATTHPARIPAALSDSAFFTERALTYLRGRNGKPFFLHLGLLPPAPALRRQRALPCDVRRSRHAPPVRASSPAEEARSTPCCNGTCTTRSKVSSFRARRAWRPAWTRPPSASSAPPTTA